jgi:glycerol-3-phosphate acyltransferase PlsY
MTPIPCAALVASCYLAGSIPFGLLVGRARGVDVRQTGSGNIGATNVGRALGPGWALLVLLLDAAKGFLPLLLVRHLSSTPNSWTVSVCMLAAVLGHIFPLWLRFRGGKGVATALGVVLALDPLAALAGLFCYALLYAASRISALGSLGGCATVLLVAWLRGMSHKPLISLCVIVSLIVLRHRDNLRQLCQRRRARPR